MGYSVIIDVILENNNVLMIFLCKNCQLMKIITVKLDRCSLLAATVVAGGCVSV